MSEPCVLLCHCELSRPDCVLISANNQWKLHEEIAQERLEDTSFYRAMMLSRGTVSVLDPEGICFSRIWW